MKTTPLKFVAMIEDRLNLYGIEIYRFSFGRNINTVEVISISASNRRKSVDHGIAWQNVRQYEDSQLLWLAEHVAESIKAQIES